MSAAEVCQELAFRTPGEAAQVADRIRLATGDRRRPYLSYRCDSCGRLHLRRRPPFDLTDPDDRRRVELVAAGWRQVNNPDVELWTRPDRKKTSSGNRKTLDDAWAAHCAHLEREQAAAS